MIKREIKENPLESLDLTKATTRRKCPGWGRATAAEKGQYKLKCGFNKNDLGLHIFWTVVSAFETETYQIFF